MTQENTKLCDLSNTNNNDFIGTLLAPPATSAETCDINSVLLNLVMKDQFSGTPNEDVVSHLNTFVELCDMQKKKDLDSDIIKLSASPIARKINSLVLLMRMSRPILIPSWNYAICKRKKMWTMMW